MARYAWKDPFWDGKRKPYVIALCITSLLLLLLFLGNFSYLYGMVYRSNDRVSALNILAVNFDDGILGSSQHRIPISGQPRVPNTRFPDGERFWGAIYTTAGASTRLSAALGGGAAAASYNASNAITYVWNGARYAAVQLGDISGSLETLIGATSSTYHALNGTGALSVLDATSVPAVLAYSNPIMASSINIMPTNQGTRVLYNTVTMVFPIIQQFFFLMALNGISNGFQIYGHMRTRNIGLSRMGISLTYTFLASLCVAGYLWAFKEDWNLSTGQYFLTWMAFWLYMHINFCILDAATAFIPPSFLSFFVLTWVVVNVTSTIYPFELGPGFYRWGYALPARETYSILVTIWSGGCDSQLHISLPVLFGWDVLALVAAILGTMYRNKVAYAERLETEAAAVEADGSRKESARTSDTENADALVGSRTMDHSLASNMNNLAHFPVPFENALLPKETV